MHDFIAGILNKPPQTLINGGRLTIDNVKGYDEIVPAFAIFKITLNVVERVGGYVVESAEHWWRKGSEEDRKRD